MKKKKVLLISPHPDDIEFFASELCMQSIKARYETHELISCCDEYGTTRNQFKGKRIRRIRRLEMLKAARHYGVDEKGNLLLKLHWANYIDGFVPFNRQSVERYKKFILRLKPDIIAGPAPFIYFDGHRDHIATGKNYYYSLESIPNSQRPAIMLFYQTLMPQIFIKSKYQKETKKAWLSHSSQMEFMINFFRRNKNLLYISRLIKNHATKTAEAYRLVKFDRSIRKPKGIAKILFEIIFDDYGWGDSDPDLFIPTPEELGLDMNPTDEIV
ncbi:MAG: hypothetical protein GF364_21935 [Candidatus Lokiarchaeota archaeon]|nr:hypothetical protein [Candidatus Lokiarchaeota archaeon]